MVTQIPHAEKRLLALFPAVAGKTVVMTDIPAGYTGNMMLSAQAGPFGKRLILRL